MNPIAEREPIRFICTVDDPTRPASIRFLRVLQGGDHGMAGLAASDLQCTTSTPFAGTSLPAPAGLAANTGYTVNGSDGALSISVGGAAKERGRTASSRLYRRNRADYRKD